jgi:hypothetical protein
MTVLYFSGAMKEPTRPFPTFYRERSGSYSSTGIMSSYWFLESGKEINMYNEVLDGHTTKDPNFQPLLMIDSGAYSAFTKGKQIDLDEYIKFCHDLKSKMPSAIYVNLDVISRDGSAGRESYQNYLTMRNAGLDPLPVFHLHSELKWLHKYLERTDYIAIGAVVAKKSSAKKLACLDELWEHLVGLDRMPICKVHGMGVTSFSLMARYPWFSIDSTSWLQASIYGKVMIPYRKDGGWDYVRKPRNLDVSDKSPDPNDLEHIANLRENVKREVTKYVTEQGFTLEELSKDGFKRMCINSLFYAEFVRRLKWPRPFGVKAPRLLHDYT